jgi:putative oxygen-independent coproporphyrinogen III oxidase
MAEQRPPPQHTLPIPQPRSLGLYIHMPWCVRKCPYCDFNSHQAREPIPEETYIEALIADFEQDLQHVHNRSVDSIFIGGGTPSLFSPESIERLLNAVGERVSVASNAEITLEANPGAVERGKFEGFRNIGITRLSIGVQSFEDDQLQALGRIHTSADAVRAIETAQMAGFDHLNLDLMFGLPGQSLQSAEDDLLTAIGLEPAHISYYQLTIEPNTLYYRRPPTLPRDEAVWAIQRCGQAHLAQHGYGQYEISAYARPGRQCRHNLNYWRFGDYLGIGAGAHGKITDADGQHILRLWKVKHPREYMKTAGSDAVIGGKQSVPPNDRAMEFLMNQLRLKEGFKVPLFTARTGLPLTCMEPALSGCLEDGLLERHDDVIRCTEFGWRFLDEILGRFLPTESLKAG